jgi:hypothetical protein
MPSARDVFELVQYISTMIETNRFNPRGRTGVFQLLRSEGMMIEPGS